jgi:hypothetical protein
VPSARGHDEELLKQVASELDIEFTVMRAWTSIL